MSQQNPIDRVRAREDAGPDEYNDAKATYTEMEAELQRNDRREPSAPKHEADFLERMQEKLNESGREDDAPEPE